MNSNLKKMFFMQMSNTLITVYTGIFINLFIWGKHHSLADNACYNLVYFITIAISYLMGCEVLAKKNIKVNMQLSVLFSATAFILLNFVSFQNIFLASLMIAVPIGIGQGLFWSGMNSSVSLFGKNAELTNFFSITGVSSQVINLIIPIFYAFFIKQFGFTASFSLMFVFILIMSVNAFFIPKISLSDGKQKVSIFKNFTYKKVFDKKSYRWLVSTTITMGVISQFQSLFVLIFTFTITENTIFIALLNVLYTLCVVISRMIYARKKHINEFIWLNLGVMLLTLGTLVVFFPEKKLLILSNILITVGLFYLNTIQTSQQFRIFQEENIFKKTQILALREMILDGARGVILVVALMVHDIKSPVFTGILIGGILFSFCIPWLQKQMFAAKEKEKKNS